MEACRDTEKPEEEVLAPFDLKLTGVQRFLWHRSPQLHHLNLWVTLCNVQNNFSTSFVLHLLTAAFRKQFVWAKKINLTSACVFFSLVVISKLTCFGVYRSLFLSAHDSLLIRAATYDYFHYILTIIWVIVQSIKSQKLRKKIINVKKNLNTEACHSGGDFKYFKLIWT